MAVFSHERFRAGLSRTHLSSAQMFNHYLTDTGSWRPDEDLRNGALRSFKVWYDYRLSYRLPRITVLVPATQFLFANRLSLSTVETDRKNKGCSLVHRQLGSGRKWNRIAPDYAGRINYKIPIFRLKTIWSRYRPSSANSVCTPSRRPAFGLRPQISTLNLASLRQCRLWRQSNARTLLS